MKNSNNDFETDEEIEDYEEDYDEYYDDCDLEDFENFEEFDLQQREAIIEEIKEIADDKVEKNKTYEQYVEEKRNEDELLPFLGPQIITKTSEEMIS